MFDITILPLYLLAGRERSELPGLYVVGAPRKAARLRAQDQLMLFMSLSNNTPTKEMVYSPAQQQEMLTRLAETFFTTTGSVTAGMRAVVSRLNEFLLSRNLRAHSEGQVTGSLNLAVLHGSTLLLAHAGPTQSMVLGKSQVQQFDDLNAGRGLGLSKQLVPRFYQTVLEPGDVLLVCATPPGSWTSRALTGASQLALDHLRRRLLGQAGVEITAAAMKFQPGKGQIIRYRVGVDRPTPAAEEQAQAAVAQPPPAAPAQDAPPVVVPQAVPAEPPTSDVLDWLDLSDTQEPVASEPVEATAENLDEGLRDRLSEQGGEAPDDSLDHGYQADALEPGDRTAGDVSTSVVSPQSQRVKGTEDSDHRRLIDKEIVQPVQQERAPIEPQRAVQDPQRHVRPARPAQRSAPAGSTPAPAKPTKARTQRASSGGFSRQIGLSLKSFFLGVAGLRAKVAGRVSPLVNRVLPQRSEPLINLSPASMLFIAICVPLVVVAIATTVYFNAGRAEQFEACVNNARQYVDRAAQQTEDPQLQRDSWTQALLWLDKADEYGQDETSVNLRLQAQAGMDNLDGITRVAYRQAVEEGFAVGVNITRMAATLNDVYLLDSNEGRVLRIYRVGNSYTVDPTFVCGPGQAAGQIIGPLIDLNVLPPNNTYRATVIATDVSGNLVYCAPGQTGYDSMMLPAPDTNWGNIKSFEIADGLIYILDPLVNAVWYIYGNNESIFNSEPRLFFSNQVPQMNDVIDMSIDKGFLYLLHSDGRMTTCEASGFELSPTRCNDPAPYGDARIGRDSAPLNFYDAHFVQMQTTQPPDPSLFILDDSQASIYHFSLRRMNLQRQYRAVYEPDFPLPDRSPTAFVITPNRRALLAYGNLVFYAPLP